MDKLEQLIRENERMRTALVNINHFAYNAAFGSWRHNVISMTNAGLYPVTIEQPIDSVTSNKAMTGAK